MFIFLHKFYAINIASYFLFSFHMYFEQPSMVAFFS